MMRTTNLTRSVQRRFFQSRVDYEGWVRRMKESRLTHKELPGPLQQVNPQDEAPFLYSVSPISDRLVLYASPSSTSIGSSTDGSESNVNGKPPSSSLLECIYPLSGKKLMSNGTETIPDKDLEILRTSISDLGAWSTFRLAKFYSDVDALTADVAYRHASVASPEKNNHNENGLNEDSGIAFVTAGHFNSRKIHSTELHKDIILRCYPTHTGRSSIEIRTDAIQLDDEGEEQLVNVCFTSMVAVDKKSLRPVKDRIPNLEFHSVEPSESRSQRVRTEMAEQHGEIRKRRYARSMYLRHGPTSSPPTQEEMTALHSLERERKTTDPDMPRVKDHTYRSSFVVYPERRNVHGKMFGGFVMEQSHILAQYAADFFLHSRDDGRAPVAPSPREEKEDEQPVGGARPPSRAIPLGMDEAVFLQPVSIGDHVTFTARVVHSNAHSCRVVVTVEVRDPIDRHSVPLRSNRVSFLFGGRSFPPRIVPDAYGEILMHVDAARREVAEGPLEEEMEPIVDECQRKMSGDPEERR